MTYADGRGLLHEYALAAMRAAFHEGVDLERREALLGVGTEVGIAAAELEAALDDPSVKDQLRSTTHGAHELGVIGVPTVVVGEQLFWGDDRLEDAAHAAQAAQAAGGTAQG